jgi:hypothetical protein
MNEESLSALLDGECSPSELDQVLRRLDQDPELRQRLSRLSRGEHLRRGVLGRSVPLDFADRVMAALPARPDRPGWRMPAFRPAWRPLAGLAAAAAFGAAAVLVLRPDATPGADGIPVAAAPAMLAQDAGALEDLDYARLDAARARHLRNYLMAYSQSRAQHGMAGTLGYARYAAYTQDRPEKAP